MYLTYSEYRDMGGTLEEAAFNEYEFEAESTINWYTFNRLIKEDMVSDNVKRLMFKLIKLIQLNQQAQSLGQSANGHDNITAAIASQSNDGFSTSYNALSASEALSHNAESIKRLVQQYLGAEVNSLGHKLLYRGVYPNE